MNKKLLGAALMAAQAIADPGTIRAAEPLRVDITEGVGALLALAVPDTPTGSTWDAAAVGRDAGVSVSLVIRDDLGGTGLYRILPGRAGATIAAWQKMGAQALVTAKVSEGRDGKLIVQCVLTDVFEGRVDLSRAITVDKPNWRRAAHRCADLVFERTTGYPGHFDTQIAYISEAGSKIGRIKRLAVMDYDGANPIFLTRGDELVALPRFSPDSRSVIYMSRREDRWQIVSTELATGLSRMLRLPEGEVFGPRFSPDGKQLALSISVGGNTDIFIIEISTGQMHRLTDSAGIDTSPSFSPDGKRIVFESSRSGRQQLYVMNADGSNQERISFGESGYASPVWSPRGDLVAFSQITEQGMRIGVIRPDGGRERLLTTGWQDESPSWAPSGRAIAFLRTRPGEALPQIWTTDISGKNQHAIPLPSGGADPAWSGVRP